MVGLWISCQYPDVALLAARALVARVLRRHTGNQVLCGGASYTCGHSVDSLKLPHTRRCEQGRRLKVVCEWHDMALLRRLLKGTQDFVARGKVMLLIDQRRFYEPRTRGAAQCRRRPRAASRAVQRGPFGEGQRKLFEFKHPDDIRKWMAFSDEELGGKSTAELYLTTKPMVWRRGPSCGAARDNRHGAPPPTGIQPL